jgi:hypothetical protein
MNVKTKAASTATPSVDRTLLRMEAERILAELHRHVVSIGNSKDLSSEAHMGLVARLSSSASELTGAVKGLLSTVDLLTEESRELRTAHGYLAARLEDADSYRRPALGKD